VSEFNDRARETKGKHECSDEKRRLFLDKKIEITLKRTIDQYEVELHIGCRSVDFYILI